MAKHHKLIWPFSVYFLLFAAVAAYAPYLALYYQSLGFTGLQIGLITGLAPTFTLFAMPLLTGLADRTNRHRLILSAAFLLAAAVMLVFPALRTFFPLFILVMLFSSLFAPVVPLSDSATMFMLRDRKELYGRVRLGGTFGFMILATLTGSLVERYGLSIAFWSASGLLLLTFFASLQLEHGDEAKESLADWRQIGNMAKNPHMLLFLLIAFVSGIALAMLNIYLFPYMKSIGATESTMGIALSIGNLVEIPILIYAGRFIKRYSAYALLLVSVAMTALRFYLYVVAVSPGQVLVIQLLNGLNYPLLMVAGVTYVEEHAPPGLRASAQGLFNAAILGIGSAVGGFAGGLMFDNLGGRGMYLVTALLLTLVLVAVILIRRALPPDQAVVPTA